MLKLFDPELHKDAYYSEQWMHYYSSREHIWKKIVWLLLGLASSACVFVFVDKRPLLAYVLAVLLLVLILGLIAQWVIYIRDIIGWNCPRCGEYFFCGTYSRIPFRSKCPHCGHLRPKKSEIALNRNREDTI